MAEQHYINYETNHLLILTANGRVLKNKIEGSNIKHITTFESRGECIDFRFCNENKCYVPKYGWKLISEQRLEAILKINKDSESKEVII